MKAHQAAHTIPTLSRVALVHDCRWAGSSPHAGSSPTASPPTRVPESGLLHHSDQGCTYASEDYQKRLVRTASRAA